MWDFSDLQAGMPTSNDLYKARDFGLPLGYKIKLQPSCDHSTALIGGGFFIKNFLSVLSWAGNNRPLTTKAILCPGDVIPSLHIPAFTGTINKLDYNNYKAYHKTGGNEIVQESA